MHMLFERNSWLFLLIGFLVCACISFKSYQDDRTVKVFLDTTTPGLTLNNKALPVRMTIPAIDVDASVEYVGITSNKAMDTPKEANKVGWFNLSAIPGQAGSSVINGHFGYKNKKPAVFDNLSKIKKGDKIYIEDEEGVVITFVVLKLKSYGRNDNASEVFASNDAKARLNLITCAGDWDPIAKTHSNRLVVFAEVF